MKFRKYKDYTYLEHLHNASCANDFVDEQYMLNMFRDFGSYKGFNNQTIPALYIIDYTKRKYLTLSDGICNIVDYDKQDFLQGGLDWLINIYHEDDFKVYNEKVFAANLEFLTNTPQEEHHQHIFSYNFRVKRKDGSDVTVWQRGSYITCKNTKLPLYSLGTVIDITSLKNNTVISHLIEKSGDQDNGNGNSVVVSNYFYPNHEDTLLSKQEKNILKYMADGFSSKMVADKMYISENTVSNHRKNMLRKTNTKNVAHLIAFAIRNHII